MAFQQAGSLTHRSHIRWWNSGQDINSGQTVWLGSD
ncbi:LssY C-terminal domain-containing protein [Vibrio celticus]